MSDIDREALEEVDRITPGSPRVAPPQKVTVVGRKRGRPQAKRPDPVGDAPIDGDYSLDTIVNKQAGRDYALMSDRDRARRQHQGWQPELWGAGCARQLYDYGKHVDGEEIKVNGQLTLMWIPSERRARLRTAERAWHQEAKAQLRQKAEQSAATVGGVSYRGKHTQTVGVQF